MFLTSHVTSCDYTFKDYVNSWAEASHGKSTPC